MKILILSISCFAIFPLFSTGLTETEFPTSTQSQGFFGYFGNIWKKSPSTIASHSSKPSRTNPHPIETSTSQPAGIFGHVKNWINSIKGRIPLNMQTTTFSVNYTNISGTINTRKYHSTRRNANRKTVSLINTSSISTKSVQRRADTEIPGISKSNSQLPNASDEISSKTKYINSYDEFINTETENTDSSTMEATNGRNSFSSTIPEADFIENSTTVPISGFFETKNITESNVTNGSTNTSSPTSEGSGSTNVITHAMNHKPITMKKRSDDYKLTLSNMLFYKADDLNGNTSKSESELILTTSNYSLRTRKSTSVKKSRSRRTKGSNSNGMSLMTLPRQRLRLEASPNTPIALRSGWIIVG